MSVHHILRGKITRAAAYNGLWRNAIFNFIFFINEFLSVRKLEVESKE
jgi:hypothetical protein